MRLYKGWQVALAGAGVNYVVGISYIWSIFASGLVEQLGWNQAQAALPYTVFLFCYAPLNAVAGRLQDRWGPRRVILTGSFLAGASFFLGSLFSTPLWFSIVWGFFFGMGAACCFASATPAAMKWFPPEKKGTVAGVVVTGIGLSALTLSPLVHTLVQKNVITAFILMGTIVFAGIFFFGQFISNPPGREGATSGEISKQSWDVVFRAPQFYMLWVMFFLSTGAGVAIISHLDTIMLIHVGYERGYIAVALLAFFNAAGRPVAGFLSDRLGRIRTMTLSFGMISISLIAMVFIREPLNMAIAVSFLGFFYGGLYSLFPAVTVTYFGDENFGFIYGLIFAALGLGGIFPYLTGLIVETTGSYLPAFILLSVTTGVAMMLSLFLKSPENQMKNMAHRVPTPCK